jgi:hypothetical protein
MPVRAIQIDELAPVTAFGIDQAYSAGFTFRHPDCLLAIECDARGDARPIWIRYFREFAVGRTGPDMMNLARTLPRGRYDGNSVPFISRIGGGDITAGAYGQGGWFRPRFHLISSRFQETSPWKYAAGSADQWITVACGGREIRRMYEVTGKDYSSTAENAKNLQALTLHKQLSGR